MGVCLHLLVPPQPLPGWPGLLCLISGKSLDCRRPCPLSGQQRLASLPSQSWPFWPALGRCPSSLLLMSPVSGSIRRWQTTAVCSECWLPGLKGLDHGSHFFLFWVMPGVWSLSPSLLLGQEDD